MPSVWIGNMRHWVYMYSVRPFRRLRNGSVKSFVFSLYTCSRRFTPFLTEILRARVPGWDHGAGKNPWRYIGKRLPQKTVSRVPCQIICTCLYTTLDNPTTLRSFLPFRFTLKVPSGLRKYLDQHDSNAPFHSFIDLILLQIVHTLG